MPSSKLRKPHDYTPKQNLETTLITDNSKRKIIKVAIGGIGGVGKTSLCQRVMGRILDDYFDTYKVTIGVQFFNQNIETKDGNIVLSVWDLAGQPQFQHIIDRFLRGCKGIILAYDSTYIESFFSLYHTWFPLIKENCDENIPIILVSTKNDLIDERQVNPNDIKQFIASKDDHKLNFIDFLETSSKSNINVKETFEILYKTIIENDGSFYKHEKERTFDMP